MLLVDTELSYQCPGDVQPITRALHLSRMAQGYFRCRQCPHGLTQEQPAPITPTLVTEPIGFLSVCHHRVRGQYLRPLTSRHLIAVLRAELPRLWQDHVRTLQMDPRPVRQALYRPSVALGCDLRSCSMEVFRDVQRALKLLGCHLVDLGATPLAQFCFAVNHFQLAAGIYINGSGCGPAWTGMDLFAEHGIPWTINTASADWLSRLNVDSHLEEQASSDGTDEFLPRLSRTSGQARQERILPAYQAHVQKFFHGLRPLRVAIKLEDDQLLDTLEVVFEKLPCQLIARVHGQSERAAIPPSSLPVHLAPQATVSRRDQAMAEFIAEEKADFGFLINDDGGGCQLYDESGAAVPHETLLRLVGHAVQKEQPSSRIFASSEYADKDASLSASFESISAGLEAACRNLDEERRGVALLDDGRIWHYDLHPRSDAIVTLAYVLKALSLSDAATSQAVLELAGGSAS